jgi:hypothetical protein
VVDEPGLQPAEDPKEEKKEPLTPITDINFPPTLHIPEYFGLDFRQVLRDYRLFHIVVMNKDKRTLLVYHNIMLPSGHIYWLAPIAPLFCLSLHEIFLTHIYNIHTQFKHILTVTYVLF